MRSNEKMHAKCQTVPRTELVFNSCPLPHPTFTPPMHILINLGGSFYLFIYLFLAALSLRCCVRAFSSCGKRGLLFVAVYGLLIAVASLVAEHRL